ncbi:hypothetical protein Cni_G12919 [Canna indica]|uniref:Uncharacterized protein n=1 Tax=Canna indica TaxID=4628 RepID=A0AAQ3QCM9_9LILI|nr:hypothetical protein Cni_G12919 [Canna indica]
MSSYSPWRCVLALLLPCFLVASSVPLLHKSISSADTASSDVKALKVGEEIRGETLPLRSGQRIYELIGLRRSVSYEIPASFSIQLHRSVPGLSSMKNRRLLNTEKLIFKADSDESVFVILTVEPEGVVAMANVPERELVIYNIVCDKLMMGIPHGAWWVGVAALLCLVLGMALPYFFPLHQLLKVEGLESEKVTTSKDS